MWLDIAAMRAHRAWESALFEAERPLSVDFRLYRIRQECCIIDRLAIARVLVPPANSAKRCRAEQAEDYCSPHHSNEFDL